MLYIGLGSTLVFFDPAVFVFISGKAVWTSVGFLVLALWGVSIIVAFINCRIYYGDEGFVAKKFLGIKRMVSYSQVTAIRENSHEAYIYIGKTRIMVDGFAIGRQQFIKYVKKKYKANNNGQR